MDVYGPVANVEDSASPRFSVFHAWWSIGANPRKNTILRWTLRPPVWWTVSSFLLGIAFWGISSAFRYGLEAFLQIWP